jgi:hypothetical protein
MDPSFQRESSLILAFRYIQDKFTLFIGVLFGHNFSNTSSLSPYSEFPITLVHFFDEM